MRLSGPIIVFAIIIMGPVIAGLPSTDETDTIILTYTFQKPSVGVRNIEGQEYHFVDMPNTQASGTVGHPRLPSRGVNILLPQGTSVKEIRANGMPRWIKGRYHVIPVAASVPLSHILPSPIANDDIYSSQTEIPHSLCSNCGVYGFRGYDVLVLRLHPVHYVPANGSLVYYPTLTITVNLEGDEHISKLFRGLKRDQEAVCRLVDNPSIASSYTHQVDSGDNRVDNRYEYVIITSQELAQHSGEFTFQEFIQYKQAQGINATIVTTESIYRNPDYWDPRPKYNDRAARIRNFIRHAYVNWHTDYVLLAGDADGDNWQDNIVPTRQLFAACIGLPLGQDEELEGYIPADVYYAGLDGTFNADGDERWGENASGNDKSTGDEADLLAEIYIGRICVDSVAEVSNFVRKTITYDISNDDYLRRVLMVGEYLGFEGTASWGANHMELLAKMLPDWHEITTLYEREYNWDSNDLAEFLSNGTHLLHHLGHGWTNHAIKMSSRDAQYLTNDKLFFIYSQTCLAGSFDNWIPGDNYYEQDSFAEAFTCESEHAAFAVIMNSRYGLGRHNSTDSPGQRYHASFIQALNDGFCELGRANQRSKDTNLWRVDENGMRWIHYEANLIGDPQLAIKGPFMKRDEIFIEVVRPTPGILYFGDTEQLGLDFLRRPIIIGPVSVEVATKGNISKVNFYLDGKHMATDNTKPYIWQCGMTTWGCHLITAVAIGQNGGTAGHGVEAWFIPR